MSTQTVVAERPEAETDDDVSAARAPMTNGTGTELAVRKGVEVRVVRDNIAVLDTARFEHMQRIASVMARSMLIPEALCMYGPSSNRQMLPYETIVANCFLVVNQAVRWNMDPFAVAQCVSVIGGKLCYEGKLIAAVLDRGLGLKLHYHFIGDPATDGYRIYVSDRPYTEDVLKKLVRASVRIPGWRLWDGSVGEWKTTRKGSPWAAAKNYPRMLIYRGSRDWVRIYESGLMLGVVADDEIDDDMRAHAARDITPTDEEGGPPAPPPVKTASPPTVPTEPEHSEPVTAEEIAGANAMGEAIDDGPPDPNATAAAKLASKIPTEDAPFLAWVKETFAACDADMLAETYTDSIEPHVPRHLNDDVMALYRLREAELETVPEPKAEVVPEQALIAEINAFAKRLELVTWRVKAETIARIKALPQDAQQRLSTIENSKLAELKAAERK